MRCSSNVFEIEMDAETIVKATVSAIKKTKQNSWNGKRDVGPRELAWSTKVMVHNCLTGNYEL